MFDSRDKPLTDGERVRDRLAKMDPRDVPEAFVSEVDSKLPGFGELVDIATEQLEKLVITVDRKKYVELDGFTRLFMQMNNPVLKMDELYKKLEEEGASAKMVYQSVMVVVASCIAIIPVAISRVLKKKG